MFRIENDGRASTAQNTVPFAPLVLPASHVAEGVIAAADEIIRFGRGVVATMRREREIRRTVQALQKLEEHVLRDIGVERDRLELIAVRAVEQRLGR